METYSHKSIQLICSFREKEAERFEQFLQSGLCTTDPRIFRLFSLISQAIRQKEHLDFPHLYKLIEPDLPYTDQRMRDQLSRLVQIIHRFLAVEHLFKDETELDLILLKELSGREPAELFNKQFNSVQRRISTKKRDSLKELEMAYKMAGLKRTQEESASHRIYSQALQQESQAVDHIFLLTKLRQYCEILNRNYIYQQEDQLTLLEDVMAILEKNPDLSEDPAIHLWSQALNTLMYPQSQPHLSAFLESLQAQGSEIATEERRSLYKYALNFCIRRINAGEAAYLQVSFDIYQRMLSQRLLHSDGWLSHTDVKNIVSAGIRVGEVEWVATFIEEARSQVKSPWSENVYTYCKSYLLAETGRKREAIRLLQNLTFSDVYYAVSARILLLRTFFEMEEYETLSYQIPAFENFLKRNRSISPRNKKLHLAFAGHLRKVVNLKEQELIYPGSDLQARKQKLLTLVSSRELSNKSWLLDQILPGASGHTRDT